MDIQSSTIKFHKDGCWEWLGSKTTDGYGTACLQYKGFKEKLAHRLSYRLFYGDIPAGMYVCHTCDNPSCVNPNHLFLGKPIANRLDAQGKKRLPPNMAAKFDKATALSILQQHKEGAGKKTLAKQYGVDREVIRRLVQRKSYKWIDEKPEEFTEVGFGI